MKLRLLLTAALAATALGGCATYEQPGASGPGGYYQGRPQVRYIGGYNYGVPYGGYGGYYGGGYYSPYRYGYGNPYYGYYGPNYPYYRPHHPPPRPGHGHNGDHDRPNPPGSGAGGNRPAPWRDPTRGAWRESGQHPMVPGQAPPPSQQNSQQYNQGRPRYQRPPATRTNSANPAVPRGYTSPQSMPRSSSSSSPRSTGGNAPAPRSYPQRGGGRAKTMED